MPDRELRAWMEARFDRLDDQMDRSITRLQEEMVATRHGQREVMEQITLQVVEVVAALGEHTRRIGELERRTGEDGPIDKRFRRHDARLVTVERASQDAGKFTWGDVAKVIGALVGAGTLLTMLVSLVLSLAPPPA